MGESRSWQHQPRQPRTVLAPGHKATQTKNLVGACVGQSEKAGYNKYLMHK